MFKLFDLRYCCWWRRRCWLHKIHQHHNAVKEKQQQQQPRAADWTFDWYFIVSSRIFVQGRKPDTTDYYVGALLAHLLHPHCHAKASKRLNWRPQRFLGGLSLGTLMFQQRSKANYDEIFEPTKHGSPTTLPPPSSPTSIYHRILTFSRVVNYHRRIWETVGNSSGKWERLAAPAEVQSMWRPYSFIHVYENQSGTDWTRLCDAWLLKLTCAYTADVMVLQCHEHAYESICNWLNTTATWCRPPEPHSHHHHVPFLLTSTVSHLKSVTRTTRTNMGPTIDKRRHDDEGDASLKRFMNCSATDRRRDSRFFFDDCDVISIYNHHHHEQQQSPHRVLTYTLSLLTLNTNATFRHHHLDTHTRAHNSIDDRILFYSDLYCDVRRLFVWDK